MAFSNRPLNSTLRHPSIGGSQNQTAQPPMLVARISEKKAELENLKQLRDLSGGLAAQMQALEEKLSTLSDGTEAVATVLSNWHNVMRAINMASMKVPKGAADQTQAIDPTSQMPLPQTLVRIPVEEQEAESQGQTAEKTTN